MVAADEKIVALFSFIWMRRKHFFPIDGLIRRKI